MAEYAKYSFSWSVSGRDWRAGELTVLIAALLIAVSAMTGVAFLTDRVGQAVEMRAAESLAADLQVNSTRPLPDAFEALARENGLQTAGVTSMPSVVFAGETSTLSWVMSSMRQDVAPRAKTSPTRDS